MKCFVFLFILTSITTSFGDADDPKDTYRSRDRFFYYARDDDEASEMQLIDSQEPVDEEFIRMYAENPQQYNSYYLFTRQNPSTPDKLVFGDIDRLTRTHFDAQKKTVFIVHGWTSSRLGDMSRSLKQVFLEDEDVNVIVVDWSPLSKRTYLTAKRGVPLAGQALGVFIVWLVTVRQAAYERIHLVGFSLGAHFVGNAGKVTQSRVQRITGLDPAGPSWRNDPHRLNATDAVYVEVIHTEINILGYADPIGHADFYPNGGSWMAGCLTPICSHYKSVKYMVASVRYNQMHANECDSFRDATGLELFWPRCRGTTNLMGNSKLNKTRSGIFRISTRGTYPYV